MLYITCKYELGGIVMDNFTISGFSDEIDSDIDVQFDVITKLGINYFEVRGVNGKNVSELTDEEAVKLSEKMKEYGVFVSSIGSPIGKISITDDFESHFETFKRVVKIAKILGTKNIRIFSFYIPYETGYDAYRNEVILRLNKLKKYAHENDMMLLHENEKGIYGDVPERCLDLAKELCDENFSLVFDPANFVQCGVETIEAFNMLKPYITYVHIKDADDKGINVPAGYGKGNIEYILSELKKDGYEGFLSLEPHLAGFSGFANLEKDSGITLAKGNNKDKYKEAYKSLKAILERI